MLPDSKIYYFIDNENDFSIAFLEGQKLISDLAVIHSIEGKGFEYFRKTLLIFQHLVNLLKHGEFLGFYIESRKPNFRLKIEINYEGLTRSLLIPESFRQFPEKITGAARTVKFLSGKSQPYTSIIELNNTAVEEIVNLILKNSYQLRSTVMVSEVTDQSIMLCHLPPLDNKNLKVEKKPTFEEFLKKRSPEFKKLFERNLVSEQEIISAFQNSGLKYLALKNIKFSCGCSRERMISSLLSLNNLDPEELFNKGSDSLEIRCDYCKKPYTILKIELTRNSQLP